jgi:signal peptidase II
MPDIRVRAYSLAALVFIIDRATKWLIETRMAMTDSYSVIPGFFDIVHSKNPGVVFGLFSDSSSEYRTLILIAFSAMALAMVGVVLWNAARMDRLTALGLSLMLGGAAGNVFDRIAYGRVTDFLEFYVGRFHWPTFNMADTAIVIGSGLVLLEMMRPKRQAAQT